MTENSTLRLRAAGGLQASPASDKLSYIRTGKCHNIKLKLKPVNVSFFSWSKK